MLVRSRRKIDLCLVQGFFFFFSKKWLKLASLSHCVDEINHLAQVKVIYAYATYTEQ